MRPKLFKVLATDDLRPALNHALLTKEWIVATDGHVLVAHKTTDIFDSYFVESIPEGRHLVTPECLKAMNKAKATYYIKDNSIVVDVKGAISIYPLIKDGEEYTYPQWENVLPDESHLKVIEAISINPKLLYNAIQAIDPDSHIVRMYFTGGDKAIILKAPSSVYKNCRAIKMPAT